jgi:hypothetical protein
MVDQALRVSQQMSPKRNTFPLPAKPWEDSLRSPTAKVQFSDYYILASPASRRRPQSSRNPFLFTPVLRNSPFKPTNTDTVTAKSELQTTAGSKSFSVEHRKLSSEDYTARVRELELENQKIVQLCKEEVQRHQSEKVNNT